MELLPGGGARRELTAGSFDFEGIMNMAARFDWLMAARQGVVNRNAARAWGNAAGQKHCPAKW